MTSLRQIKTRIRTIENTAKVTKAMEMVAASKMRRAQGNVLAGRPYSEKIEMVIANLAAQQLTDGLMHPLLANRTVKHIQIVHLSPDRGLCGGLHSGLNRLTGQFILDKQVPATVIAVGRKGRDFMMRYGQGVEAAFTDIGDKPRVADATPIAHLVINGYTAGQTDEVYISYAEFVSTVVQKPVIKRLLPIQPSVLSPAERVGYIYEPDGQMVLNALLPRFVEMEIYHTLLELIASEQSARMVAMKNATDSANDMVSDLTLLANKVRQESITNELLDIVGGAAALQS